ncbi:DUF7680 family protein [Vreelandella piezotolerans]|uniref:DUF7680 domain-containing protein n=1 Tax=Vreelandella piezotolerans TaxID=2609667 RepID=A0ABQ6X7J1_9GAMM|nr:hypothetical protein [Halomonas piezotolerans]KAE8437989.1 hypothetical protein F1978_11085 [Halomonas piezotolerans]QJA23016.1 hypothetical protein GYM47_02290 [Halomonas piezotolerans]
MATDANPSSRGGRKSSQVDEAQLAKLARRSPYVLRLTRHKDMPPPVLTIKERIAPEDRDDTEGMTNPRAKTVERGNLYGDSVRACLPVLKRILEEVKDEQGIPLGLETYMNIKGLQQTDLNFPLDETAGARLALFFRLQSKVKDVDRIELIGRRVAMFSREEAVYWLANVTTADPALRSWATSGLRILLCGDAGDKRAPRILEKVRARG